MWPHGQNKIRLAWLIFLPDNREKKILVCCYSRNTWTFLFTQTNNAWITNGASKVADFVSARNAKVYLNRLAKHKGLSSGNPNEKWIKLNIWRRNPFVALFNFLFFKRIYFDRSVSEKKSKTFVLLQTSSIDSLSLERVTML